MIQKPAKTMLTAGLVPGARHGPVTNFLLVDKIRVKLFMKFSSLIN